MNSVMAIEEINTRFGSKWVRIEATQTTDDLAVL
jgi:hypothetical protein